MKQNNKTVKQQLSDSVILNTTSPINKKNIPEKKLTWQISCLQTVICIMQFTNIIIHSYKLPDKKYQLRKMVSNC